MGAQLIKGDALDLILAFDRQPDIVVTDPPYALRGDGDEHAISATVAIVLREAATRLRKGGWMLVMCASSWRSQAYMVEAVRGIVEPVRTLTWCKPSARTKAKTSGPAFASVQVLVFKKGKSAVEPADLLDHITAPPVVNGRRAELPPSVADWMVRGYGRPGDLLLDPFAGSGAILAAAERAGLQAVGFERNPPTALGSRSVQRNFSATEELGYKSNHDNALRRKSPQEELGLNRGEIQDPVRKDSLLTDAPAPQPTGAAP